MNHPIHWDTRQMHRYYTYRNCNYRHVLVRASQEAEARAVLRKNMGIRCNAIQSNAMPPVPTTGASDRAAIGYSSKLNLRQKSQSYTTHPK
eukprot:jgi/Psemu1/311239/fgenesh1_kg.745_\